MDTLSKAARSERMGRIASKDTKPELLVRRLVRRIGVHFTTHRAELPGRPDLVFARRQKVIFVHGCFWHRHAGCGRLPKSRLDFWLPKLDSNRQRDRRTRRALAKLAWRSLVIWECQTRDATRLERRIRQFLNE